MTSSLVRIQGEQVLTNDFQDLSIKDLGEKGSEAEIHEVGYGGHGGICAICLDKIVLQETALVKGCEHAYCVTCILHWATYREKVTCPQCKHPFEFLNVHRSLDGSIQDYMFEESVCLLLRASWFTPLSVEEHVAHEDVYEDLEDYYQYEDDDDMDEAYYGGSSNLRVIGNRRWGDNGYVRAGRQEARPVHRLNFQDSGASSSSREPKKKEVGKIITGRRAKRAQKREAADKAAEAKHLQHLIRLGRK
uniref:RING-type domain-containing protein n=1 Tax=Glycine max TaxID=3847 RepID=C6TLY3_SOYBN|nr:unknown [Glycine max]